MPMKNASDWILQTIESIQKQTLADWELILVDDYSEDDSFGLVEKNCLSDKRINILKNPQSGIISALNQAFQKATGKYITRMDADDIMPENRLQIMSDFLQNQPAKTIVTGKVIYFSDGIVSEGYRKYESWLNERIEKKDFYEQIYRECIVASPNWMGRTEEFRKYDLFSNLNYPEDYDLCFLWMKHEFSIKAIDEITLFWREHPLRTSRNSSNYQQEAFFRLKLNWFTHFHPYSFSIGIIGMGIKGKICAEHFNQKNYPFSLYDLNFEKFNSPLFGKQVLPPENINNDLILIARYPDNLDEIQRFIESKGYMIGENAFWV